MPIDLRTSKYNFLACASLSGVPCLNESKSLLAAAALILEADIPATPSASGSLSPALNTSTFLNS